MLAGGHWNPCVEAAPKDGQRIILLLCNGGTQKKATSYYKIKPVCAYYVDGPKSEWREVFTGQSLVQWKVVGWAQLLQPPVDISGSMIL